MQAWRARVQAHSARLGEKMMASLQEADRLTAEKMQRVSMSYEQSKGRFATLVEPTDNAWDGPLFADRAMLIWCDATQVDVNFFDLTLGD